MSHTPGHTSEQIDHQDRPAVTGEKCLAFQLGDDVYALALRHVLEIVPMLPLTAVPEKPSRLCGTLELRRRMIAVVDLARMLGRSASANKPSCIVIVQTDTRVVAVLADRLVKVAAIPAPGTDDARHVTVLDPHALHDAATPDAAPIDPALLAF